MMSLLRTSLYRRRDNMTAVQVNVNELFSFDLVFANKVWSFVTSERAPAGRYLPPQSLHGSLGRVALHTAQIAFWNGWEMLDSELEAADELRYLPDQRLTALDRFRGDAVAREAYMFVWSAAFGQLKPPLRSDEIFYAKQIMVQFDEQLDSVDLDAQSWSVRELGEPV
ncbi:hypothetical protein [Microbacterium lacus]|uniref:hypothetical protein n=1 Tax=Microbacterium lacus TaxID=415217 RepID=UPI0018E231CD|nr:hypothetical protein [Microbacterium lacus]